MVTPEMAAELEANAREDGVSISTLVRQMIETQLDGARESRNAARTPAARREWKRAYDAALAKASAQGAEHVRRHRASDAAARGRTTPAAAGDAVNSGRGGQ